MIELLIAGFTLGIAFLVSVFLIPGYIKKAKAAGLTERRLDKYHRPGIPIGGMVFILGFLSGILLYVLLKTFYLGTMGNVVYIFAIISSILLAALLGLLDDMLRENRLSGVKKFLFTVPIGIPLMVLNVGEPVMEIPFIGIIDFGIVYPLLIVPLLIIVAANLFDTLGGFSGLEAGLGAIMLSIMGFISWYVNGVEWLALVSFIGVSALLGFLVFNWNPARILPGNSMTYGTGALIAMVAILGNMERILLILFIPFILDALMRAFFRNAENFYKVNEDFSLDVKETRRLGQLAILIIKKLKKKCYETNVTLFFYFIEIFLALVVFLFFI